MTKILVTGGAGFYHVVAKLMTKIMINKTVIIQKR